MGARRRATPPGAAKRSPCAWGAALCLLVLFPACSSVTGDGYRRQHRRGQDLTDRAFLSVRWAKTLVHHGIFTYSPEEFAGAAASNQGRRIYIGTSEGRLWALDERHGAPLWEANLGAAVTSPPLVVPALGLLYVGAGDGAIHALDLSTGARRWRYRTKGIAYHAPVYADGVIYFTNHRDQLYSLDARTGKWRWSYDRETPEAFTVTGHSGAALAAGRVYAGFSDGTLVCLATRGGEVLWSRSLAGSAKESMDVDTTPVLRRGLVYAASMSSGVFALTAEGGALQWRFDVKGVSGITVTSDHVYLASARQGMVALDPDGRLAWTHRLPLGSPQAPVVRGRMLAVTFSSGGLVVLDRLTGSLVQRFNPGGGISGPPLLTRDSLYVLSNRGRMFAMTLR